jgi:hypothetical protein
MRAEFRGFARQQTDHSYRARFVQRLLARELNVSIVARASHATAVRDARRERLAHLPGSARHRLGALACRSKGTCLTCYVDCPIFAFRGGTQVLLNRVNAICLALLIVAQAESGREEGRGRK